MVDEVASALERLRHNRLHNAGQLEITLMCEYGVTVPLFPQDDDTETLVSAGLLAQLVEWQQSFDANFHWEEGWRSDDARSRWIDAAQVLYPKVKQEIAGRAPVVLDLWLLTREKRSRHFGTTERYVGRPAAT